MLQVPNWGAQNDKVLTSLGRGFGVQGVGSREILVAPEPDFDQGTSFFGLVTL